MNAPNVDPGLLISHIAALAEFVRFAPDSFERKSGILSKFLLNEVLLCSSSSEPVGTPWLPPSRYFKPDLSVLQGDMEVEDEWVSDKDLIPLGEAKVLAIKVCRHRCLAHARSEVAADLAKPVISMLVTLLENGGALPGGTTDE